MKCVIPGTNARIFAKAIQSFSRVGSELFIEADSEGLSIRTVNSTRSAFALIRFLPNFFTDFDFETVTDDEYENKCKVSIKACLGTFKNMKQVELCKISIDSTNLKLVIQLKCQLETIKTFSISILDLETLQAVYMTDNAPNKISAPYKIFTEISSYFQMNEEEITLEACKDNIIIKNYLEGSHVDRRFMRSQLSLKADEFDKYLIGEETSITFCLREFRAFLNFAETINLDLAVNFETSGKPVVFVLKNLQTFEANLVMSTLSPDELSSCDKPSSSISRPCNVTSNSAANLSSKRSLSNQNDTSKMSSKRKKSNQVCSSDFMDDENEPSFDAHPINLPPIEDIRIQEKTAESEIQVPSLPSKTCEKTKTFNNTKTPSITSKEFGGICVTFTDTQCINNEECIPMSPERERKKRARTIFRRCFEATFTPSKVQESSHILAPNSDTEE